MSLAKVSTQRARTLRRLSRRRDEDREKRAVRRRDGYRCRFPQCGCRQFRLALHCAHLRHKAMGGNPTGDRSLAAGMIFLCSARHRMYFFAIDRGTLRCRPLTAQGANGPVAWDIDGDELARRFLVSARGPQDDPNWVELAVEDAVQQVAPPTAEWQTAVLAQLAEMTW